MNNRETPMSGDSDEAESADRKVDELDYDELITQFDNPSFGSDIFIIQMTLRELVSISEKEGKEGFKNTVKDIEGAEKILPFIKRASQLSVASIMLGEFKISGLSGINTFLNEKRSQLESFLHELNNRLNEIKDDPAEAGNDWQETLKARHEQINNESDSADSEIGRTKRYISKLVEIYRKGFLISAAKNVEGLTTHIAFIERVMKTGVATAILADFQEGWGFDAHISAKRKRLQVFYERVVKKLDEDGRPAEPDKQNKDVKPSIKKMKSLLSASKIDTSELTDTNIERIYALIETIKRNQKHLDYISGFLNEAVEAKGKFDNVVTNWEEAAERIGEISKQLKEAKESLKAINDEKSELEKKLQIAEKRAKNMESKALAFENALNDMVKTNDEDTERASKTISRLYEEIARLKEDGENVKIERITLEAEFLNQELARAGMEGGSHGKDFKIAELKQRIDELKAEIKKAEMRANEADNNTDRARQVALSLAPPAPDSTDGKLVTKNQELQEKVEKLRTQIAQNEIENANFPHQIELLESEVKRLNEYIDSSNELPVPEINAISDLTREKKDLEKEIERLNMLAAEDAGSAEDIKSLNTSNEIRIQQLERELNLYESGNNALRYRNNELEAEKARLTKELEEAKKKPSIPPASPQKPAGSSVLPPKARRPSNPPTNGADAQNNSGLPKPGDAVRPPRDPNTPLPPPPRPNTPEDGPRVVLSDTYIYDVEEAKKRAGITGKVRWFIDRLFSYGMDD